MEHKKDIGKAIREKLGALDKAPSDGLWAAIEADLPKKKKRRFLPFWIGIIGIMVIGLLIWSLNTDSGSNSQRPKISNDGQNAIGNTDDANPGNQIDSTDSNNGNVEFQNESGADQNADSESSNDATSVNSVKQSNLDRNSSVGNSVKYIKGDATNHGKRATADQSKSSVTKKAFGKSKSRNNKSRFDHALKNGSSDNSSFANASGNETLANSKMKNGQTGSESNSKESDINGTSTVGTSQNGSLGSTTNTGAGKDVTSFDLAAITEKKLAEKAKSDSIAKALVDDKKKIAEKQKDSLAKQELEGEEFKTFRIFLYAAPTYYNTFSKLSSIDKDLDSLPHKAEITYNYGGYLVFDYDDKWAFRFGIAKTKLRHSTQGIPVSSLDQQNYYNVDYGSVSNLELQSRFADSERFDLIQDVTYVEFPVEIKYKAIDKKFGIDGIGGVSTNLLKKNSVTAESDNNGSVVIGSTKDQYKAYFSVNVGAGFYWKFADNFRLNLEPIFKYHFRTSSAALQPYSIVVLGGLEYTFNWRKKKADKK